MNILLRLLFYPQTDLKEISYVSEHTNREYMQLCVQGVNYFIFDSGLFQFRFFLRA